MNIKMIHFDLFVKNTPKMLRNDSPIFLQNIDMVTRFLFLLSKKSTTFSDNPCRLHYDCSSLSTEKDYLKF